MSTAEIGLSWSTVCKIKQDTHRKTIHTEVGRAMEINVTVKWWVLKARKCVEQKMDGTSRREQLFGEILSHAL